MLFHRLFRSAKPRPVGAPRSQPAARLSLEGLNDRIVPALLWVGDASVVEGKAGTTTAAVVVSLDAPARKTMTVNYATADGTAVAGADYLAAAGTLTFARGEMSKTIQVPVIGDRIAELDETFFVNLLGAQGAKIADGQAVVTIVDDEPRIWISGWSGYEGDSGSTFATFTVYLTAAYDEAVTVNYATGDGTAIAGVDYLPTSGTLTFAPGETTKTITVEVLGDVTEVAGNKTFGVTLSGASPNALIIGRLGEGIILDSAYDTTNYWGYQGSYDGLGYGYAYYFG